MLKDTLKTKEKCLKVAEEAIVAKKSCVIDNTNPAPEDRKIYIDLAKKYSNWWNFKKYIKKNLSF